MFANSVINRKLIAYCSQEIALLFDMGGCFDYCYDCNYMAVFHHVWEFDGQQVNFAFWPYMQSI